VCPALDAPEPEPQPSIMSLWDPRRPQPLGWTRCASNECPVRVSFGPTGTVMSQKAKSQRFIPARGRPSKTTTTHRAAVSSCGAAFPPSHARRSAATSCSYYRDSTSDMWRSGLAIRGGHTLVHAQRRTASHGLKRDAAAPRSRRTMAPRRVARQRPAKWDTRK